MLSTTKLMTGAAILAIAAMAPTGLVAQNTEGELEQAEQEPAQQTQQDGGGEKIDLVAWPQEDLYQGWTASQLFDAEVEGDAGEVVGEIENLVITPRGSVEKIIVESGGWLDLGDTHFAVPWNEVKFTPDLDEVRVPVTEGNLDEYSVFDEEQVETDQRAFLATELINDYVTLNNGIGYGMVQDLVISQTGELQAVVVYPDVGYGVGAPYAYPYYGYEAGYGFEPGSPRYGMPYTESEIAELGPFDYSRLGAPLPGAMAERVDG